MTAFEGTAAKALIRNDWDLHIIRGWHAQQNKPLSYFGLPGKDIEDLLDWRPYLGYCTGVERLRDGEEHLEDLEVHRRLLRNVMVRGGGLSAQFELLRGYIEDVILNGKDLDNTRPHLSTVPRGGSAIEGCFSYDLVNLDFLGGISYERKNEQSIRTRAIKKLFERQQGTSFLLFLTINVRNTIGAELTRYLDQTIERVDGTLKDVVKWYTERPRGQMFHKLKAVIPLFIRHTAEENLFVCEVFPPIKYVGTGDADMLHFVFKLNYTKGNLHAFGPSDVKLLNLPLMAVRAGKIVVSEEQHENFDFSQCASHLAFLPADIGVEMLR